MSSQNISMKIVHLSFSDRGGAGIAALRLHQGLLAAGLDSRLLTLDARSQAPGVFSLPAEPPTGAVPAVPGPSRSPHFDEARRRFADLLRAHPRRSPWLEAFTHSDSGLHLERCRELAEADLVHLHWVAGLLDTALLPGALAGRPVVWTLHDMNPITGGCHYTGECERFTTGCGACPQLGSSDPGDVSRRQFEAKAGAYAKLRLQVCTPSRWLAAEVARSPLLGTFPVEVIPNGLPLDVFRPRDRLAARRRLGVPEGTDVLLFGADSLGNRRKGLELLLQSLGQVASDSSPMPFLCLLGAVPRELKLPWPAKALGRLSDERTIAEAYAMADLVVVPSLQDNLPNAVLESLACGTPVAAFRVGGIPDAVDDGHTGFLATPGDPRDLARAIRIGLERSGDLRSACRAVAEARYGVELQARRYVELYGRLLEARAGASPMPTVATDRREPARRVLATGARPAFPRVARNPLVMVNLGCGHTHHPAWLNIDANARDPAVLRHDVTGGIPLGDGAASVVYHSHLLEHLPRSKALAFLRECYRVLVPGGIVRVVVPDLEGIARAYLQSLAEAEAGEPGGAERHEWMLIELLDQMVRNVPGGEMLRWWGRDPMPAQEFVTQRVGREALAILPALRRNPPPLRPEPADAGRIGRFRLSGEVHQWMYDHLSLARLMGEAGFSDTRRCRADESWIPGFVDYQLDTEADGQVRKPDSLFMEARKR